MRPTRGWISDGCVAGSLTAAARSFRNASVGQGAVEADGQVRAVAGGLVGGVSAATHRELRRVGDFSSVGGGEMDRSGDQVRAVLLGVMVTSSIDPCCPFKTYTGSRNTPRLNCSPMSSPGCPTGAVNFANLCKRR
jgi:hypothetical protein